MSWLFDFASLGIFSPSPKWTDNDMPDLTGQVAVITGANSGIGKESARSLLAKGAKVYALCRSPEKAKAAMDEIKQSVPKRNEANLYFTQCDLSDIASAAKAGKTIAQNEKRLDIILLSAGVMFPPRGSTGKQGFELQFCTNVLGHYALVRELQDLLIATAQRPETKPASVRIVWVSSSAHYLLAPQSGYLPENVERNVQAHLTQIYYGISKLANVQMANAMAKRLRKHKILVVSVHPGNIKTELQRYSSTLERSLINLFLHPVSLGKLTQLYAATSTDLTLEDSGAYFVPWARKHRAAHKLATDTKAVEETFEYVDKAVKRYVNESPL